MGLCAGTAAAPKEINHQYYSKLEVEEKQSNTPPPALKQRILIMGNGHTLFKKAKYKLSSFDLVNFTSNLDIHEGWVSFIKDTDGHLWQIQQTTRSMTKQSDNNYNMIIGEPEQFNYFHQHNIKINKICISKRSNQLYFICDKHKAYSLGIDEYHRFIWPWQDEPNIVNELKNVIDIQLCDAYSVAICKGNDNNISCIIDSWTRCYFKYYPSDIKKLMIKCHGVNNKLYSFGNARYGAIAQGVRFGRYDKPKYIKEWTEIEKFGDNYDHNIIKVSVSSLHTLFLEDNGVLWCCGFNQRHLYDDTSQDSWQKIEHDVRNASDVSLPIPIRYFMKNQIKIVDVKCGTWHNLAIDDNHNVYSWGSSTRGQCGDRVSVGVWEGDNKRYYHPELIPFFKDVKIDKIDCGHIHSYCRTLKDGKHYLFGHNANNECITYDNRKHVTIPHCIDDIVKERTNGMRILRVFLGYNNTKIVVSDD